MRTLLKVIGLALLLPVLYVASAAIYFPAILWHRTHAPSQSAMMKHRAREAAAADQEWTLRYDWVPLTEIAQPLQHGVLAAEDTRFYEHDGFDWEQIRNAWEANRTGGSGLRGASTITQQTVKNLYLSPSRNVLRKAREAVLTVWMEMWLPKERILELYLNVVELGPGLFGAEAASRAYFDKPAARLTRSQAALLAATLPAPLARNPAASTRALRRRQNMILSRMGRWYEGPSLAEEDAANEAEASTAAAGVDSVLAEPIELEPLPADDSLSAEPPPAEAGPEAAPDGAEPEPPVPVPGDSAGVSPGESR